MRNRSHPGHTQLSGRLLQACLVLILALGALIHATDAARGSTPVAVENGGTGALATLLFIGVIGALILVVFRATASTKGVGVNRNSASYRSLFDSSPLPMWVMDEESLRIIAVNQIALNRYGYTRQEFLRLHVTDLQVAEDRSEMIRELRERDPSSTRTFRRRHVTKGGEVLAVDVTARPFTFNGRAARMVLINEVTARLAAERELQESEQRYRDLFERSPIPMWVYDVATLRYLAVNQAAVQQYGYTGDEFSRMTITDLHLPEMVPGLLERVRTRDPQEVFAQQVRHQRKDGSRIEVDLRSGPIVFAGRQARQVLALDVTEMRNRTRIAEQLKGELEQRVAERTAQLEAANSELEAFSYSVSHDLRAPLRSIEGFSNALLEDYAPKLDEIGRDYVQRIGAASKRMSALIDALLDLARVARGDISRTSVNLSEMAQEIAEELKQGTGGRDVTFRINPGLECRGDANLLRVVLENLLSNAWKFTSGKSVATITFDSILDRGETVFFVRDTGAGFDMAYADRLFGAFQRLHSTREFPGTGIGLATVRRIINRHGGRVWAESKEGEGAAFFFTLP
jgi:PAS domain S-box-containing protein